MLAVPASGSTSIHSFGRIEPDAGKLDTYGIDANFNMVKTAWVPSAAPRCTTGHEIPIEARSESRVRTAC